MKEKDAIKAFLGEDTEFIGSLNFEGTVRIDGKFEGEIKTDDNLIIGEHAQVKAEIISGTLMVQGKIDGNIMASKKLHVTSTGQVIGNVSSPAIHIEDGAVVEGTVSMSATPKAKVVHPKGGASTPQQNQPKPEEAAPGQVTA